MTLIGYYTGLRWLEVPICTAKRRNWRPAYQIPEGAEKPIQVTPEEWERMECDCGCRALMSQSEWQRRQLEGQSESRLFKVCEHCGQIRKLCLCSVKIEFDPVEALRKRCDQMIALAFDKLVLEGLAKPFKVPPSLINQKTLDEIQQ